MSRLQSGHADGLVRRASAFDVVDSKALRFFPELVTGLGGSPQALLQAAKIDPLVFTLRDAVIEYRAFISLLEASALALNCPDFGLRLATRQRGGKVIGPIGVVMKNSETVGQALGYCVKHIHAYSLATKVRFRPDRSNRKLSLEFDILLDGSPQRAQAVEHALLLAHLNVIDITGGLARGREIAFRHDAVAPLHFYRTVFGCDVKFGQHANAMMLTEQDLLVPIMGADAQIYDMATSFIDSRYPPSQPPMHARVRALTLQFLGTDDCTIERVAREMCVHPRTLQRRLRAEGQAFENIKDEVRRETALRYLQLEDMPLTNVAQKLGYAEASVLSRSCYRWFASSPLQLRKQALSRKKADLIVHFHGHSAPSYF